jgi:2-polyprenyl-6-methoxyphenol hydroxylase-like FAD-dependent oxidoreductase
VYTAGVGTAADLVVVGGGIAGSALATVMARDGYQVVVLERQRAYRDKVRGEALLCWGVVELLRLELEKPLLDANGRYVGQAVSYDELTDPAQAEAVATRLDRMLPDVPGVLSIGHPDACEALIQAATTAGASVLRGVGDVAITPGDAPVVRYRQGGRARELHGRLIAGADGRMSTIRRQLGITLHQSTPRIAGGGMLVAGLDAWPAQQCSIGTEDDLHYFVFPQANGRARLYLMHDIAQRGRFTGPDRQAKFLTAFGFRCIPGSEMFRTASPAGPCAFYPMNDGWTDQPYAPGVVLIGDAAGWNNPIIGQGLAIALRDVRIVADILRHGSNWSTAAFAGYRAERRERMRRLRVAAQVRTDLVTTFNSAGVARRRAFNATWRSDPVLSGLQVTPLLGPDSAPAASFTQATVDRIRTLS